MVTIKWVLLSQIFFMKKKRFNSHFLVGKREFWENVHGAETFPVHWIRARKQYRTRISAENRHLVYIPA